MNGQILMLLYTIFITLTAFAGFGRHMSEMTIDEAVHAVYTEMIGQTFVVVGMTVAKISLGLFLLRIVVSFWQEVVLWINIVAISISSLICAFTFWPQCIPS